MLWATLSILSNVESSGYDGPERRARPTIGDIENAAMLAAEKVMAVASHARRMTVLLAIVCSLLANLAVALPVTVLLNHQSAQQAHVDARANCLSLADSRPQGNDRALVEQAILMVADQAFRSLPARFQMVEIARINKLIAMARSSFRGVVDVKPIARFSDLTGYVALLNALSC